MSWEVVVTSKHENTDTLGHLFPTVEEAEFARESVIEWHHGAVAELVERNELPTITYDQWMERGW